MHRHEYKRPPLPSVAKPLAFYAAYTAIVIFVLIFFRGEEEWAAEEASKKIKAHFIGPEPISSDRLVSTLGKSFRPMKWLVNFLVLILYC